MNHTTKISEDLSVTWLDRDTVEVNLRGKTVQVFVDYSNRGLLRVWRIVRSKDLRKWSDVERSDMSEKDRLQIIDGLTKYYKGRLIVD